MSDLCLAQFVDDTLRFTLTLKSLAAHKTDRNDARGLPHLSPQPPRYTISSSRQQSVGLGDRKCLHFPLRPFMA
jgi:hypothetical protein